MDWRGSGWTGEGLNGLVSHEPIVIVRVYKKIYMCVNLEWVAGSRWTCEGLDELVSL